MKDDATPPPQAPKGVWFFPYKELQLAGGEILIKPLKPVLIMSANGLNLLHFILVDSELELPASRFPPLTGPGPGGHDPSKVIRRTPTRPPRPP